jgi:four helix bundle protein
MPFKFEKLKVWGIALELTNSIDQLTKQFPKEELYVLTSQIKRAADSIALNIAEGSTGQSDAEFVRFLNYSIRSSIEVVACLYVGKKRGIIGESCFNNLYEETEKLLIMLQALKKSLKNIGDKKNNP